MNASKLQFIGLLLFLIGGPIYYPKIFTQKLSFRRGHADEDQKKYLETNGRRKMLAAQVSLFLGMAILLASNILLRQWWLVGLWALVTLIYARSIYLARRSNKTKSTG
jgi:amino acid transporter